MSEDIDELCRLEQAGKQSDFFRSFSLVWVILSFVLMLSGLIAWIYYRQHYIYIRKRSLIKPFMLFIAVSAGTITGPLDRAVPGRENEVHSCTVLNISYLLTVPFFVIAGLSQVILFRNQYKFYKALGNNAPDGSEASSRQSYFQGFDASLRRMQLFANEGFIAIVVIVIATIFVSIVIGVISTLCPEFGNSDVCAFASLSDLRIIALLLPPVLVGFLLSFYIHKKLKTFPDPFNLLGEIKTAFFYGLVLSIPGFLLSALNIGDPNGQDEVPFSYSVWIDAVLVFVFVYSVHWQLYKAVKFDEVQLLYKDITLRIVLNDSVGRDLFRVHLMNEFSLENLLFVETVEQYQKCSPEKMLKHAQQIYELFFDEDILNLKYQTRENVKIRYNEGLVTLDLFNAAYNEIFQLLSRDSFVRFQLSPDFETYIGLRQNSSRKLV